MNEIKAIIATIEEVTQHPNGDRLDLYSIAGKTVISSKVDDEPRYRVGQFMVYVPIGAFVPDWLLREGFWDEENNKGGLGGETGNVIEKVKLRKVESEGLMFPLTQKMGGWLLDNEVGDSTLFNVGDDVTDYLGVK